MLHDISINLADAFVRTGHYDKGAMWYRKALSYCDSLKFTNKKLLSFLGRYESTITNTLINGLMKINKIYILHQMTI